MWARIERLAELRQKAILTEEEFTTKKAELLAPPLPQGHPRRPFARWRPMDLRGARRRYQARAHLSHGKRDLPNATEK